MLQPFVEQGLLGCTTGYFLTSNVLEREYGDEEPSLGWMHDGVYELFEQEGQSYRWQTEEQLVAVTEKLS